MRYTLRRCWHLTAEVIIVAAILVTALRFTLPMLNDYRQYLAAELGIGIGQPVSIGHLAASWHGMGPLLILNQVHIYAPDSTTDLLRADDVKIGLNLWQSLFSASLVFDQIEMSGAEFTLVRETDGRIGLEGFTDAGDVDSATATATESGDAFIRWLFEQGAITVRESDIRWINKARQGHPKLMRHVNLELSNDGRRHQIEGDIRLSSDVHPDVRFSLDLLGDVTKPGWDGRGYLESLGVNLVPWLEGRRISGFTLTSGKVGMRLWLRWKSGRLQDGHGRFVAAGLDIRGRQLPDVDGGSGAAPALKWRQLAGSVAWRRLEQGWALSLPDLQVDDAPAQAAVTITAQKTDSDAVFEVYADRLGLKGLLDWVRVSGRIPASLGPALKNSGIDGRLDAVHLSYRDGASPAFAIKGGFSELRSDGDDVLPGFDHLSGSFVADDETGALQFDLNDTAVTISSLFRNPIPVTSLSAGLSWQRDAQGLVLAVNDFKLNNEDLNVRGGLGVVWPKGGKPDLSIHLDAKSDGGVAHTSRYLPAKIMAKDAVEWLDQALIGGDVTRATVVFDGPVAQFPFEHGGGRFGIQVALHDGVLDFAPGWPRVDGIEADLAFAGHGLKISARHGESLGLAIHDVSVDITDLYGANPNLKLHGKAEGTTQQALDYVVKSPVGEILGGFVTGTRAAGSSDLDLTLDVPLMHSLDTQVNGRLGFHDSKLNLVDAGLEVEAIQGALAFTESDVWAKGIRARILGLDSRVNISRKTVGKGRRVTRIAAAGRIDARQIDDILGTVPDRLLSGATGWRATLDLADAEDTTAQDSLLRITSDLKGMAVAIPDPLAKAASIPSAFSLTMRLPQRLDRPVVVKYGRFLSGLLDLDAEMRLQRADLHWGAGRPGLGENAGVRITGSLDRLDLDPWLALIERPDLSKRPVNPGSQLTSVDVQIGDFSLSGHHLPDVDITGNRQRASWRFVIRGPELGGEIEVPIPIKDKPIRVALDHLIISVEQDSSGDDRKNEGVGASPRQIPALEVTSDSLIYADMQLGSMRLSTAPSSDGMDIRELVFERPESSFHVHGTWTEKDGTHASEFAIRFSSKDLGGTFQGLSFPNLISQGHGESSATIHWPGRPTDFTWPALGGQVNVLFQDGRVLEIEPGAGRIVGLFSLQSLPRRLFMDFSDVLRRGYAFDRIEGDLDIDSGVARTQNLYLDGPSARIEIKGATDLAARQYDQDVIVSPHVGSGLPVAGALAGGLGVGAAVLIFERIFQHDLAKMTRVHYHVTGPWSAPETVTVRDKTREK